MVEIIFNLLPPQTNLLGVGFLEEEGGSGKWYDGQYVS